MSGACVDIIAARFDAKINQSRQSPAASIELEPFVAHEPPEIGAFGNGDLPRHVLRSTVTGRFTEAFDQALARIRSNPAPPGVVGIDNLARSRIIEAFGVHRRRQRQARAQSACVGRPHAELVEVEAGRSG